MGAVESLGTAAAEVPLVCPQCRAALPVLSSWPSGAVACAGCGRVARMEGGIPRFVATDGYTDSFSFEWLRYRQTQLDAAQGGESERTFRAKTGWTPDDVKGRLILDAGCGMGRFAEVVSRWGGRVVAVDLSRAVDAAQENLAGRDHVLVCQADLRELPFPDGCFDLIYSIGVLHHTPNCEQVFRGLIRYLAPGGTIAVWLYANDGGVWIAFSDFYRRFTTKLPSRMLHALAHLAVPAYYFYQIPVLGRMLWTIVPMSMHPRPAWRVLDTFDWYSPRYQSKHTDAEVISWFQAEGLVDIKPLGMPVAVSGVKSRLGSR